MLKAFPEPTWKDESRGIYLYFGDCTEIVPRMPKHGIDAVITDPPFFMPVTHYQSRVQWPRSWADTSILTSWWAMISQHLRRAQRDSGHVLVFCNSDSYPAFYPAMFPLWAQLKCLVWDKGRVGLGRIFRHQHELMIWGRNAGHYVPKDGILRADILAFPPTPSRQRKHPVEKPAALLAWLIEAVTPLNGIVLDPFMGSGTAGTACIQTGRRFVGVEKDETYFKNVVKSMQKASQTVELFREA